MGVGGYDGVAGTTDHLPRTLPKPEEEVQYVHEWIVESRSEQVSQEMDKLSGSGMLAEK